MPVAYSEEAVQSALESVGWFNEEQLVAIPVRTDMLPDAPIAEVNIDKYVCLPFVSRRKEIVKPK